MPEHFYSDKESVLVAVDCIIMGFHESDLHILIAKRPFDPLRSNWSLMGGFVKGNEGLSGAVQRVLYEYTGLTGIYMEQVGVYGEMNRDLGERVISIAHYALVDMDKTDISNAEKHGAKWVSIRTLPKLVFDHNLMVTDTIKRLQQRAAVKPIGFNLLGDQFTLPTLQALYEAIYQEPIDKRNFRKKILAMDILEKLETKDKDSSKKGAFYYQFNKEKYELLIQSGLHFSL
jgi:ADP-ribose pyrophosphatase YjhB (NUDIX family)